MRVLEIVIAVGVARFVWNFHLEGVQSFDFVVALAPARLDGKLELGDREHLLQILVLDFNAVAVITAAAEATGLAALEVVAALEVSFFRYRSRVVFGLHVGLVVELGRQKAAIRDFPFEVDRRTFRCCIFVVYHGVDGRKQISRGNRRRDSLRSDGVLVEGWNARRGCHHRSFAGELVVLLGLVESVSPRRLCRCRLRRSSRRDNLHRSCSHDWRPSGRDGSRSSCNSSLCCCWSVLEALSWPLSCRCHLLLSVGEILATLHRSIRRLAFLLREVPGEVVVLVRRLLTRLEDVLERFVVLVGIESFHAGFLRALEARRDGPQGLSLLERRSGDR